MWKPNLFKRRRCFLVSKWNKILFVYKIADLFQTVYFVKCMKRLHKTANKAVLWSFYQCLMQKRCANFCLKTVLIRCYFNTALFFAFKSLSFLDVNNKTNNGIISYKFPKNGMPTDVEYIKNRFAVSPITNFTIKPIVITIANAFAVLREYATAKLSITAHKIKNRTRTKPTVFACKPN